MVIGKLSLSNGVYKAQKNDVSTGADMHKAPIAQLGITGHVAVDQTDLQRVRTGLNSPVRLRAACCTICEIALRPSRVSDLPRRCPQRPAAGERSYNTYPFVCSIAHDKRGNLGIIGLFPMIYIAIGFTLLIPAMIFAPGDRELAPRPGESEDRFQRKVVRRLE